jgi:ribosomal protein S27AE
LEISVSGPAEKRTGRRVNFYGADNIPRLMPTCPNCAASVDTDQRFCADCGADLNMRADGNTATVDTARPGGDRATTPEPGSEAASAFGSESTNITLPLVLGWGVGVLLVMAGVGGLVQGAGITPSFLYALAGAIAIPPTREWIEAEAEISLSRWMVVVLVAALFAAAASLATA